MKKRIFTLQNKGMNRDLSISKAGESSAYENHNIRILARDNDTMLSVTNERGNKEIPLSESIEGVLIGWNVLNRYLILFSHELSGAKPDHIYRVEYVPGEEYEFEIIELYNGNLEFDEKNPIESVVYFESENIQKIYWVDGKNVLRAMNFVAESSAIESWDDTSFDSNRKFDFGVSVEIEKDNSGNTRPNGVIQYLLSYYNKNGQETGYVWMSDLVYLNPPGVGGSADETNNNKVTLRLDGLDESFYGYKVYSIFRSSYNGQTSAFLVAQGQISDKVIVIDDAANQTAVDATALLYLGSQNVVPGTLTHKDQTLFLGDLTLDRKDYDDFEALIRQQMFEPRTGEGQPWECKDSVLEFMYSDNTVDGGSISSIPFAYGTSVDKYDCQLELTSSQICSFKGGEKYRFGLVFFDEHGASSDAFWIGDKVNELYPIVDVSGEQILRVVAKCTIPSDVVSYANVNLKFVSAQLVMAEASYADRSVKAQGILNPTMFNVWERYNGRVYSVPSWISRPKHAGYASDHFEVVHNSISTTGEIECNYWEGPDAPKPYYQLVDYGTANEDYLVPVDKGDVWDRTMVLYSIRISPDAISLKLESVMTVIRAKFGGGSDTTAALAALNSFVFEDNSDKFHNGQTYTVTEETGLYTLEISRSPEYRAWQGTFGGSAGYSSMVRSVHAQLTTWGRTNMALMPERIADEELFFQWCNYANVSYRKRNCVWNRKYPANTAMSVGGYDYEKADEAPGDDKNNRWFTQDLSTINDSRAYDPAFYNRNYMFVDENVLTFESPEIAYESTSLDKAEKCKLRILGVAKVESVLSDSVVDATHAKLPGKNLYNNKYSGALSTDDLNGLISWPMWNEYGLVANDDAPEDTKDRLPSDYKKTGNVVRYWLHLWNHTDKIDGYSDVDEDGNPDDYSRLKSKTFANLRLCYSTMYDYANSLVYQPESIRLFQQTRSQLTEIIVDDNIKHYDGVIDQLLTMPEKKKYPILYSTTGAEEVDKIDYSNFLYSAAPVPLSYSTSPHAVISLYSNIEADDIYYQRVLPTIFSSDEPEVVERTGDISGAILPWIPQNNEIPLYVNSDDPIPVFNYVSGSEDSGRVSLSYLFPVPVTQDEPEICYWGVWKPAVADFPGREIYTRIEADNNTIYIVDISEAAVVVDFDLMDGYLVKITNAKVLSSYESGGTSDMVPVHYVKYDERVGIDEGHKKLDVATGALADYQIDEYPYIDYRPFSDTFGFRPDARTGGLSEKDQFFYVAELFYEYDNPDEDPRYGGITESAVKNNRFVVAGPRYDIIDNNILYANQGDAYFQRWDNLRTRPLAKDDVNNVIDIVSVMLETHINLDGRTDLQRHSRFVASLDLEQYGVLNKVYSQQNNFISKRDLDPVYNLDQYQSSITWTLDKQDMADTDEWMHITLASSLKLDGDKGRCRALRRFQNNIIAFQDKGIAEILFNSRTQIATTNGVPIEIANSGKVDGKRYITNKYGCLNKWSIVEGKAGLYFVDNINKMFGKLADGIDNLAARLGFSAFFREINDIEPWNPADFNNIISYYDRIHSDIYLVRKDTTSEQGSKQCDCLVYNETIGAFTSFFDYGSALMMTNIEDRFISSRNNKLWLQNEGLYCNFFNHQYDFWTWYRATPDPYGDKLWTNIEYRADVYEALDKDGVMQIDESDLIDDRYYLADETFDTLSVWNEYQRTNETVIAQRKIDFYSDVRKKFRIWRMDIPRAIATESNKYGFDRIRNPWVNIKFKKGIDASIGENQNLMQIHDLNVIYFE